MFVFDCVPVYVCALWNAARYGCLPTCEVERAVIKTTLYALSTKTNLIDDFYDGLDFEKVTVVRVFMDRMKTVGSIRQSYFRSTDLFSQLGGIFNVFFGCSVLSLLELLQLLWYATRRRWSKKQTSQQPDKNVAQ
ncbi:hypothetical protein ACJJTC_011500 [Scirpophaga incertulas]